MLARGFLMGKKKKKSKEELEEERRIAEEEETKRLEGPSAFVADGAPLPLPLSNQRRAPSMVRVPSELKAARARTARRCRPAFTLPDDTVPCTPAARYPHRPSPSRTLLPFSSDHSLLHNRPHPPTHYSLHHAYTTPPITRPPRALAHHTCHTRNDAHSRTSTPHRMVRTEEAKNKEAERLRKEQEERERQDHLARLRKEELARLRREEVEHADILRDRRDTYSASCEAKERDEEWRKYVDCNPRPDASVESELNTYIKTTEESKEVDLTAVLRSCQYTEEVRVSGRATKEGVGGGARWRVGMGGDCDGGVWHGGDGGRQCGSVGIGTREGEQKGTGQGSRSERWW